MTVIAATVYEGKIYMSADSAMTLDDHIVVAKHKKLRKTKDMLIGFAGNGAQCQELIDYDYPAKKPGQTGYDYVNRLVKPVVKEKESEDDFIECLIGIDNKLFSLVGGLILEHDYYAIGSGFLLALGALYVNHTKTGPKQAVLAACLHNTSCQGPVFSLKL